MRITDITVPENGFGEITDSDLGITSPVRMSRLGKMVVLAGPNGAGKSRLLRVIQSSGNYYRGIDQPDGIRNFIVQSEALIQNWEQEIQRLEGHLLQDPSRSELRTLIVERRHNIETAKTNVAEATSRLSRWQWFMTDPPGTAAFPVFFIPTNSNLANAEQFAPDTLMHYAEVCRTFGQTDSSETVPSYLKVVMRRARNASHANMMGEAAPEDEKAIQMGGSLKDLVAALLGERADLRIDRDDRLQIFGRHDFWTALSEGQKVLLKLAVQLHAQKTDLANALIFLDEPENHLHPAVLNQVVDVLLSEIVDGQIWIATHSVPLIARLASLDPASLWFMKDGTISHAGKRPELVLSGLLGDQHEISRLRDFTDLPAKLAANRYAAECLLDPTTVSPRTQDRQQVQMVDVLVETSLGSKLRVLDFGAGQGRLLSALSDAGKLDLVDYIAFDIDGESNAACKREIEKVYGIEGVDRRFFTNLADVLASWGHVDVAVMCNVLHEIPPDDWQREIGPDSRLMELISPAGFLLVIEDQRIPVGENAHDYGFLVFDTLQFQKLFGFAGTVSHDLYKKYDAEKGGNGKAGRLLAHRFARSLAIQFTQANQQAAIIDLYKTASHEMSVLRRQAKDRKPSFQDGQAHAFWMTQYANAALWLSAHGAIRFSS